MPPVNEAEERAARAPNENHARDSEQGSGQNPFAHFRRQAPPPPARRSPSPPPPPRAPVIVARDEAIGATPYMARQPASPPPPPAPAANPFARFAQTSRVTTLEPRSRETGSTPYIARATMPTRETPRVQEHTLGRDAESGTMVDFLRVIASVGNPALVIQNERNGVNQRAANWWAGRGRQDPNDPNHRREFGGTALPVQEGVEYEGGPLSGMLNALPDDIRETLDRTGREARLGAGFALNAHEDDRTELIRNNVPTAEFRRDARGNLEVRFGPDEEWQYMNAPGASPLDFADIASLLARYLPASKVAAVPELLSSRAIVGGLTSAATEYASESADDMVGGPEGTNLEHVATAGAWGAGGQLAGDLIVTSAQMAPAAVRRITGARRTPPTEPLPNPAQGERSAASTYASETAPTTPRSRSELDAARNEIHTRADDEMRAIDDEFYNNRLGAGADMRNSIEGAEVDQVLVPPAERTAILRNVREGRPAYVQVPGWRRRVAGIDEKSGVINWADDWEPTHPSARGSATTAQLPPNPNAGPTRATARPPGGLNETPEYGAAPAPPAQDIPDAPMWSPPGASTPPPSPPAAAANGGLPPGYPPRPTATPRAGMLNRNQEADLATRTRGLRDAENRRLEGLARLDAEEYGTTYTPYDVNVGTVNAALGRGEPVFVEVGQGPARRVVRVEEDGLIDEGGAWHPIGGSHIETTADGMIVGRVPLPGAAQADGAAEREVAEELGPRGPAPTGTAADIYAAGDEFGLTVSRGEARQDVAARTREYDMLMGRYGQGAQREAARMQDVRAGEIRQAGMNIATRGGAPLTDSVEDAGQVIANEVSRKFQALDDQADRAYAQAFEHLGDIRVSPHANIMDSVEARIVHGAGPRDAEDFASTFTGYTEDNIQRFAGMRQAMQIVRDLQETIRNSRGSGVRFAVVERTRQRLRQIETSAQAQPLDAQGVQLIRHGFDEWLDGSLLAPQTIRIRNAAQAQSQAIEAEARHRAHASVLEARAIWQEREELFSSSGMRDRGGRTMEQIREPDRTGTQVINQILGAGRIPPQQALASVKYIRRLATETDSATGRIVRDGAETTGGRRFAGNRAQPPAELQALREAMWHRILEPVRAARRVPGTQVPVTTIINDLDNALNGPGRAITREMFTTEEVRAMERFLQVLRYMAPTSASRPTGVILGRALGEAADGITRFIGGAPGALLRGIAGIFVPSVREAGSEIAARTAFSHPLLEEGLPSTGSGGPFAQLFEDNEARGTIDAPLDSGENHTSAADAYGLDAAYGMTPATQGNSAAFYEAPIDEQRPIISNDNGSFSTERTITIEVDGRYVNIPTIVNGHQVSVSNAIMLWEEGSNPEVGSFSTEAEALQHARDRSQQIGRLRGTEAADLYQ